MSEKMRMRRRSGGRVAAGSQRIAGEAALGIVAGMELGTYRTAVKLPEDPLWPDRGSPVQAGLWSE